MAKKYTYYNYKKLWSYNAVFNFLVGGRGLGKTYGAKKAAITAYLKRGEQFIYVRRYLTELKSATPTFFADIAHEFPEYDFRVNGGAAQISPASTAGDKKRPWETMGYFMSLSTAQSRKSVAYPLVTLVIFDEFIIENSANPYLKDEANIFQNLYNTVDRNQDKTRVLFLANSVSIMNPYFMKYEVRPDQTGEFVTSHGGFILCHFPDSKEFAKEVFETRFGKFIQGTDYADFAVSNTFEDAHEKMVGPKDPTARYKFTIETKHGTFSVWYTRATRMYHAQEKRPAGGEVVFTLMPERMETGKVLLTFQDKILAYLRTSFRTANVTFDKPSTRNAFTEIFTR